MPHCRLCYLPVRATFDPETECWFKKEPNSNWQQAKVIEMQSDRKYTLQSHDGAQYQRNRIHVRPSPKLDSKGPSTGELSKPHSSFPPTTKSPEGKTTSPRATDDPYTRLVRDRNPPTRYKDFVMKWYLCFKLKLCCFIIIFTYYVNICI